MFELLVLNIMLFLSIDWTTGLARAKTVCKEDRGFEYYCEGLWYCCDDNTKCCLSGWVVLGLIIAGLVGLAIAVGILLALFGGIYALVAAICSKLNRPKTSVSPLQTVSNPGTGDENQPPAYAQQKQQLTTPRPGALPST